MLAPPYDVLSSAEARQRARGKPWSFLHVSKAEIDLPEGTDPYSDAVYAKAAENLQRMIAERVCSVMRVSTTTPIAPPGRACARRASPAWPRWPAMKTAASAGTS